jgi:hypothetical protein
MIPCLSFRPFPKAAIPKINILGTTAEIKSFKEIDLSGERVFLILILIFSSNRPTALLMATPS